MWFTRTAQIRREEFASRELSQARVAAESGNLQLAASDLSRVIGTYGGTSAGQEAVLLLANVHLQQSQPDLAVSELQTFLSSRSVGAFESPAAALLGGALEELGRFGEAADAYQRAAQASPYDQIRSLYVMDHGRAATLAGDTTRAAAAYQSLIDEDEESAAASEAKFRLAELGRLRPR